MNHSNYNQPPQPFEKGLHCNPWFQQYPTQQSALNMNISPITESIVDDALDQQIEHLNVLIAEQTKLHHDFKERMQGDNHDVEIVKKQLAESKKENEQIKTSLHSTEDLLKVEQELTQKLKVSIKEMNLKIERLLNGHSEALQVLNGKWKGLMPPQEIMNGKEEEPVQEMKEDHTEIVNQNEKNQELMQDDTEKKNVQNTVSKILIAKGYHVPKLNAYIKVHCGDAKFRTRTIKMPSQGNDEWMEEFQVNGKETNEIVFELYNEKQSLMDEDELISRAVVVLHEETEQDLCTRTNGKAYKTYKLPLVDQKGKAIAHSLKTGERAKLKVVIECDNEMESVEL